MTNSNLALINELKDTNQDFEYYPTTNVIIRAFFAHVHKYKIQSLLDIGAGNGKVLKTFETLKKEQEELNKNISDNYTTSLFAIEKALPLLNSLPSNVSMMGVDFWEQSLLDKQVDCIFSNPIYSDFVRWTVKLIREANANFAYLVIPERWKDNQEIKMALEARKASFEIIGKFDFLESEDRKARAKVELVFINFSDDEYTESWRRRTYGETYSKVDPFALWIEETYQFKDKFKKSAEEEALESFDTIYKSKEAEEKNALVAGNGLINYLHQFYMRDMSRLTNNYMALSELDPTLLKELNISVHALSDNIKSRVKGLKNKYWGELFSEYEVITKRFTEDTRTKFLNTINSKTNLDFNPANAFAITAWAIKNANTYLDNQLIDTFDRMAKLANVENYKSNQKVYKENSWSYLDEKMSHIKLVNRIILQNVGGLNAGWNSRRGLSTSASNFISDLLVVADNLNFQVTDHVANHDFDDSSAHAFTCKSRKKGYEDITLFTVRAYMNGNLHLKLNKEFALALNLEVGRLKGWIHNVQHGAEELDESQAKVSEFYNNSFKLLPNQFDGLLLPQAA